MDMVGMPGSRRSRIPTELKVKKPALPFAPLQRNHRDLARCFFLVLAVRVHLRPPSVDAVALLSCQRGSDGIVGLVAQFDDDFRVREQIVIPIGMGWRAPFGGENKQAVTIAQLHHRVGVELAALRAGGREQK